MANVDWLLTGPSWVRYRALRDLLDRPEEDPDVAAARQAMLAEPQVIALAEGLSNWPGQVLASHKSAQQPFHRLNFLVDLGLTASDLNLHFVAGRILDRPSAQGPFLLPMNISKSYGGSGEDTWAWALCDAPLPPYALVKAGLGDHPQVQKALQFMLTLVRDNGWPCAVSPELGSWRGPGRKADPCPYATLVMLKLIGNYPELTESPEARIGVETLLGLWQNRRELHPYVFYAGTDFSKLKAPLIWYDLLHWLDVLSNFPTLVRSDPRFLDALSVAKSKATPEGTYVPESVYQAFAGWEFAQKKTPSRWITFLLERIEQRVRIDSPDNPPLS